MSYCEVGDVAALLRVSAEEFETEIETAITDFDARIDNKLKNYESVPLTVVPSIIKTTSKFGAAALWLHLSPGSEATKQKAEIYEQLALSYLNEYIQETHFKGKMG